MDAETKAPVAIGLSLGFAILTTIVVSCRLYARCYILRAVGNDDWTMLGAQILAITVSVVTIMEAEYGLGRHVWTQSPDRLAVQLKLLFSNVILYNIAMNLVKISFLLQYRRIFLSEKMNRLCIAAMVFVVLWGISQVTISALACLPISAIIPSANAYCLNTVLIWYLSSAMSLVTDFCIFLIPLPSVIRLHIPRRQKYMLMVIFCLGFFVCIISIIRILTIRASAESQDPTWDNTETAWWSVVELNTAILCSSLPTLRPLLARVIPGFASTYYRTGDNSEQQKYGSRGTASNHTYSRGEDSVGPIYRGTDSEELGLSDVEFRPPGAFAECSASTRGSEDVRVEMETSREVSSRLGQITVTRETSVRASPRTQTM